MGTSPETHDDDSARSADTDFAPPGLTTPRSAGIAGVLFATLFTSALVLLRPSVGLDPADIAKGLSGSLRLEATVVVLYLVPFAGIAFLWFIGAVRDRIGALEDRFFATVFLGSGFLFVAMLFGAAAMIGALLAVSHLTAETAGLGRAIAHSMLYVYGSRSAGVFTLVTSTILLRTRAVPRWVALAGFAVGLALLLGVQFFELTVLLFPVWVTALSVTVLVHARRIGREGVR